MCCVYTCVRGVFVFLGYVLCMSMFVVRVVFVFLGYVSCMCVFAVHVVFGVQVLHVLPLCVCSRCLSGFLCTSLANSCWPVLTTALLSSWLSQVRRAALRPVLQDETRSHGPPVPRIEAACWTPPPHPTLLLLLLLLLHPLSISGSGLQSGASLPPSGG